MGTLIFAQSLNPSSAKFALIELCRTTTIAGKMWIYSIPITLLLAVLVASAPTDLTDGLEDPSAGNITFAFGDSSNIYFQSDLDDGALVFRDEDADDEEEVQWNDNSDFGDEDVKRHITKRSPIPPFDPISKTIKKTAKLTALKTAKLGALSKTAKLAALSPLALKLLKKPLLKKPFKKPFKCCSLIG